MKIAIIGAGVSGAVLANGLAEGNALTIVEKSRGLGGRMATRSSERNTWDHGAPFFTARTPEFKTFLKPMIASGALAEWDPKMRTFSHGQKPYKRLWYEPHFIGHPRMKAWINDLIQPQAVITQTEVLSLSGRPGHWFLTTEADALGPYDWVISTAPSPQSQAHLAPFMPDMGASYLPGLTLLAFAERAPAWHLATCKDPIIRQVIQMDGRPGRMPSQAVVVHAQTDWAKMHLDKPLDSSKHQIKTAAEALCHLRLRDETLHRWRYSRVDNAGTLPFWHDPELQLAACGDWGGTLGVESAFVSSRGLLTALKESRDA